MNNLIKNMSTLFLLTASTLGVMASDDMDVESLSASNKRLRDDDGSGADKVASPPLKKRKKVSFAPLETVKADDALLALLTQASPSTTSAADALLALSQPSSATASVEALPTLSADHKTLFRKAFLAVAKLDNPDLVSQNPTLVFDACKRLFSDESVPTANKVSLALEVLNNPDLVSQNPTLVFDAFKRLFPDESVPTANKVALALGVLKNPDLASLCTAENKVSLALWVLKKPDCVSRDPALVCNAIYPLLYDPSFPAENKVKLALGILKNPSLNVPRLIRQRTYYHFADCGGHASARYALVYAVISLLSDESSVSGEDKVDLFFAMFGVLKTKPQRLTAVDHVLSSLSKASGASVSATKKVQLALWVLNISTIAPCHRKAADFALPLLNDPSLSEEFKTKATLYLNRWINPSEGSLWLP